MKSSKILFAVLASAAFVGCADDSFVTVENGNVNGLEGKLVDAGLFSVQRSEEGEATRAFTSTGKFIWMPTELQEDGSLTDARKNQKVGFSWTGRNTKDEQYSPVKTLGSAVYTNYEYEHVGWLDHKADQPSDLLCYEGQLMNGAYIVGEGTPAAKFAGAGFDTPYQYKETDGDTKVWGEYDKTDHPESSGELNLGRGIFRTNNASVFEGEYLVYYPYTNAFTKGEIIAELPTTYNVKIGYGTNSGTFVQNRYAASSETSFAIGRVEHYDGGSSAASFKAYTVNGFAVVRLFNHEKDGTGADVKVKQVMLYSEKGGILYSQKLDASKVVAALEADESANALTGKNVYYGAGKTKNVVYANLNDGTNDYVTVDFTNGNSVPVNGYAYVALPILPQTISDLKIILVNDKDQTLTIDASNKEFKSYVANTYDINLDGKVFQNEYMVVDEASLWSAWEKINTVQTKPAATHTIKMLNDIKLEGLGSVSGKDNYNSWFFTQNTTITSPCGATLTLASEQEMSLKGYYNASSYNYPSNPATLTIDVPVVIEGAGCCEDRPAVLVVGNMTNANGKVVFKKDVTNHGTLVLNNNSTAQTTVFEGTLTNSYDDGVALNKKAAAAKGAAEVYMLGANESVLSVNKLNNVNGKVEVAATSINLDELFTTDNLPVTLNAEAATEREVKVTINELNNDVLLDIHKMTMVTVNNKFVNTTDAVVVTSGEKKSETDGRIDIFGSAASAGVIDNQGVANLMVELANTGLFIDRQSGQVGGKMVNNGTSETGATKKYGDMTYKTDIKNAGIYVAQVETKDRMGKILSDNVIEPSTNIVEVLGVEAGGWYNLNDYEDNLGDKDVIINAKGTKIFFMAFDTEHKAQLRRAGHCVTVLDGNNFVACHGRLVVNKDLIVENGATAVASQVYSDYDKSNLVVQGNVVNNGTLTNNATYFQVVKNLENTGTFTSTTAFKVDDNVVNKGTFTSQGNNNLVGDNFTQTAGASTFASKTTTIIEGTFSCTGGTFERLTVGGEEHRATVNVNILGDVKGGTTTTAWPTEY